MFDFLQPVIDFFSFIVNAIKQLISMVQMGAGVLKTFFGMLPPVISVPAVSLIVLCVLYKIFGRENQS